MGGCPRAMAEETIRSLAGQLCSGLEAAHSVGIIHRDLKPANLRVTPDGRLKILDFGIAKLVLAGTARTTAVTEPTLGIAGTPPYMAPEQIGGGIVDARTDIHAVGAVLYEMATGQHLFSGTEGARLASAILHESRPAAATEFNLPPPGAAHSEMPGERAGTSLRECTGTGARDSSFGG